MPVLLPYSVVPGNPSLPGSLRDPLASSVASRRTYTVFKRAMVHFRNRYPHTASGWITFRFCHASVLTAHLALQRVGETFPGNRRCPARVAGFRQKSHLLALNCLFSELPLPLSRSSGSRDHVQQACMALLVSCYSSHDTYNA